ncbi:low-specificity L-threonine aldolase [bacterium]|nr:low-specificity L-threonine aldolase [bacterium]
MKTIDLRSDTVTKPSPDMRAAMAAAEVGDDVFGEDPTVNELQQVVARMFDKEAGLFVPSGTMGNQLAVKTHTQPGNEIILEADAHIFKYEAGAAGMLSGVITKILPGTNGVLSADQIDRSVNNLDDIHAAPTGLIALENTHNRAGGTIYPIEEIKRISDVAHRRNIPLHLDGARVMNACVASNIKPLEYGKFFDSISICLSKGLGAPAGSVLVGTKPFIDKARYFRKAFGGGMRQVGILAAAGLYALRHNVDKLREDHLKARKLAESISELKSFTIDLPTVQTNIVIFSVKTGTSYDIIDKLKLQGILAIPFSDVKIRFVTHLDVSMDDIDHTISILKKHFN